MSSRAAAALAASALAACHGRSPPPRERVLARIPADAQIVLAAAGPALAAPRMRPVVDVLRPRWPARFGCVIDAALAGDEVAAGITAARDLTVVIATHAPVHCAGLSRLTDDLWIATLGGGAPATGPSVLDTGPHVRARTYLATAPIAASIALPGASLLATASPEPLEAWLAIDTLEVASAFAEQKVRGIVDRMTRAPATAPFANQLAITHDGTQVMVRLSAPVDADLAVAVRTVLDWYSAPAVRAAVGFTCPPLGPPIVGCTNGGTTLEVTSLPAAVAPLAEAQVTPIIRDERVAWLRLDAPIPSLGLQRGDLLLAVDGRRLGGAAQLPELLRRARGSTTITIQRDAVTTTLQLAEPRGE